MEWLLIDLENVGGDLVCGYVVYELCKSQLMSHKRCYKTLICSKLSF